jgi:DNA-directed RNA polymerase sigma subunit (sigma70/sigma32)
LGVEAVLLERLLFVERRDSGEAIEMVASQEGCSLSRQELGEMAHRLPVRFVRRFLGEEYLAGMATDHGTEWRVETQEKRRILRRIYHALREALHSLAEEELRILRLQYHEGLNLTEVAHRLDLPRRRVYTVRDRSLRQMRRIFEQWGISPEEIERILGGGAMQVQIDFQHRAVRAV